MICRMKGSRVRLQWPDANVGTYKDANCKPKRPPASTLAVAPLGRTGRQAGRGQQVTYHAGSDTIRLTRLEPLQQRLEHKLLEDRAVGLRAQGICYDGQQLGHGCQQLLIICVLQQQHATA